MAEEREYVLGTGDDELERLGFQHRVWRAQALRGWEMAGFAPGHSVLDVGCGPGYAAFDLAGIVGPTGRVHGVDVSERFVSHFRRHVAETGAANLTAEVGDVASLDVGEEAFDGAWARWVLCFVPDPGAVVRRVAGALKPGGRFVVMDYLKYEGVLMAPEDPTFSRVWAAMVESWRASGGDPHVGARLPALMHAAGMEVTHLEPIVRVGRPGEDVWRWPRTFFTNYLPTLVANGFIAESDLRAFDERWAERERDPAAFFSTPPMIQVVAVKR